MFSGPMTCFLVPRGGMLPGLFKSGQVAWFLVARESMSCTFQLAVAVVVPLPL